MVRLDKTVRTSDGAAHSKCVERAFPNTKCATRVFSLGLIALVCFLFSSTRAPADDIYVATSSGIEKFDSSGNESLFANIVGSGLAFDSSGYLYVANGNNNTIEKFDSSGTDLGVFADSGLNVPAGLAFDGSGNLFVLNVGDVTIMRFGPSGTGSLFVSIHTGISPQGPVFDKTGNLYVAISDPPDGIVTIDKYDSMGSASQLAFIFDPLTRRIGSGLAFDSNGDLYIALANALTNTIDKVNSSGNVSPFASSGSAWPRGLAFGSSGDLYVANWSNNTIEKFDANGNGSVLASGLNRPTAIAIQVPEPATWSLLALGVVTLFGSRRLHHRSS